MLAVLVIVWQGDLQRFMLFCMMPGAADKPSHKPSSITLSDTLGKECPAQYACNVSYICQKLTTKVAKM